MQNNTKSQRLAPTLGVAFDVNSSYEERKEAWRISGKIVHTSHITQTAVGSKEGFWTSVISASVFVA